MIKYILKQNKIDGSPGFGKWYAYPVVEQTMSLKDLAKHMAEHNFGFSEAMCIGVLTAMVKCIKEQVLEGKNVKIDDLAIFSCGIRNASGGAASVEEFNVVKNIKTVKLRSRATGTLTAKNLDLEATLKKATATTLKASTSE
ncbi:MAG: DNA-binding protein [Prevotellaceae bacterium]|nr:DNA-binding protein [Prevotellaceae bacterium]